MQQNWQTNLMYGLSELWILKKNEKKVISFSDAAEAAKTCEAC